MKTKWRFAFSILLLGMGLIAISTTNAQRPSPLPTLLTLPPEAIDRNEIQAFVEAIYLPQTEAQEALQFLDQLDKRQRYILAEEMSKKAGVPVARWINEWQTPPEHLDDAYQLEGLAFNSSYDVQMPSVNHWWTPANAVWSHSRWADNQCDSDPNDEDHIIYYTGINASAPSGLRWTTIQAPVAVAFNLAYGGYISTFGYHAYEARLCIGNTTLSVIGLGSASYGASVVHASTYLTPNN